MELAPPCAVPWSDHDSFVAPSPAGSARALAARRRVPRSVCVHAGSAPCAASQAGGWWLEPVSSWLQASHPVAASSLQPSQEVHCLLAGSPTDPSPCSDVHRLALGHGSSLAASSSSTCPSGGLSRDGQLAGWCFFFLHGLMPCLPSSMCTVAAGVPGACCR